AAVRLGWSIGTLRGRLERGRELLRQRLTRRGLTVPAVLTAALAADSTAAIPPALVSATSRAALAALTAPAAWISLKALTAAAVLATGLGTVALVAQASRERERPEDKAPVVHAPASSETPPRVDREGVPLPPGALARLGSTRMRHAGTVYD